MRLIYLFLLLPFFASAQCDPEGILLELQATTAKVGILFAEDGCIDALTVGSPLTFTGGVLDITSGDLTAASSKVTVTGGTGAVLGAGATVDVVPGNILLSTLGGTLNLSQINQGGATLNQVMQWNGTTWAPATATATTDLTFSGASSPVTLNSSTGTDVTHTAGTGISLTGTSSNMTITNTLPDVTVSLTGAGINAVTGTYPNFTITGTEVDGSVSNEGSLTVGAGTSTTSIINSNTSGSTGVTITAGSGLTISETGNVITLANSAPDQTVSITGAGINAVTGTYPNFTITGTEVDGSVTNEAQTLSTSGTTSGILTLSTAGGAGGGTATIAAGTGITVGQSGGTITITNSSPASGGWLLDGNTITSAKRIGSNDNFDVVVETNGTDRMWFDNAGTVSIGATQLTTAALNINGLQGGIGQLIAGGTGLVAPNFYQATGSGSGTTATVFSGSLSMISGNVESIVKNTATTGTGGGALYTTNVTSAASSNDAFFKMQIDGVTDWSMGIDNDDIDNLKIHRFDRPSSNNGVGTIELGYDGTSIGMAVNKTGVGTAVNAHYALDALGKIRGDQFVNNDPGVATTGTYALGTAAGTGPSLSISSKFWGNGGRLIFTSGTSPTANGVICTVTLGTEYTFVECAPIMQGRTTNTGGLDYACTFNSATRVITCTLIGTLAASTNYEFNLIISGHN